MKTSCYVEKKKNIVSIPQWTVTLGYVNPKYPFLPEVAFGNGLYCRNGKQTRTLLRSSFHLRNQSFNTQTFSGYSSSKLQHPLRFRGVTIFYMSSVPSSSKFRSVFFFFFFSASLISRIVENLSKLRSHLWNFSFMFSVFLIFLQLYVLYLNVCVSFMYSVVLGKC